MGSHFVHCGNFGVLDIIFFIMCPEGLLIFQLVVKKSSQKNCLNSEPKGFSYIQEIYLNTECSIVTMYF